MKISSSFLSAAIIAAHTYKLFVNGDNCNAYTNPNSNDMVMVTPPLEVVGIWNGTNCGLNDASPMKADLAMYANGTNIWYFNDIPQTGDDGVEAVIGWTCLEQQGTGYWWGQTKDSDHYWCNLFQVTYEEEIRQVTYINYAFGGKGQYAQAAGACPTDLTDLPADALQATITRMLDENETLEYTCKDVSTIQPRTYQSCRSQFQITGEVRPNPFDDGNASLPVIDGGTCQAIHDNPSSAYSAKPIIASFVFGVLATTFGVALM